MLGSASYEVELTMERGAGAAGLSDLHNVSFPGGHNYVNVVVVNVNNVPEIPAADVDVVDKDCDVGRYDLPLSVPASSVAMLEAVNTGHGVDVSDDSSESRGVVVVPTEVQEVDCVVTVSEEIVAGDCVASVEPVVVNEMLQRGDVMDSVLSVEEGSEEAEADEESVAVVRYKRCIVCDQQCSVKIKRCKCCRGGRYCSSKCRAVDEPNHAVMCGYIKKLEEIEASKRVLNAFSVRELNQVKVRLRNRLVKLVGEKPMLDCSIGGRKCDALWDTGAMVSMVSLQWLKECGLDFDVMSVEEFLEGDKLHLCAANNTNVDVEGIAVLNVGIGTFTVSVPFLITKDELANPIIGYNVIRFLVKQNVPDLPLVLRETLPALPQSKVEAVIALIQSDTSDENEVVVSRPTVLPANSRCRVKCRSSFEASDLRQNVVFTAYPSDSELEVSDSVLLAKLGRKSVHVVVSNPTNQPVVLEKGAVLGSIESLAAIIPVGPRDEDEASRLAETIQAQSVQVSEDVGGCPVDLSHLEGEEKEMAEKLLWEERDVFCLGKEDHGDCPDLQMEIHLTDTVPVVVPHRQIPRPLYEEVKNFINDLISNNWVRESTSSYSSPIVCVRKKDGSLRLCIDYRALNRKMIPDRQPIPRIQEIFDALGGQEWFSTLDMAKAYHQGYVAEDHRKYTAFSTPWGIYEWIRVPMGISNAPPAFQRFINQTLLGLRDKVCVAYLDDILVYGVSFKDHVDNLRVVLQRLKSRGIKLRADKCFFFRKEVRYLGRLVSKDGHRPDPMDTAALEKFRTPPKTVGDLRSLLGFFGYYRNYVHNFSLKFKPIYDLLQSPDEPTPKGKKKSKNSNTVIQWTTGMQQIVDDMIDHLKSPAVLAFPDYTVPFTLNCDASERGLGAVLYQKIDGVNKVISFASRTLTKAEKNYHLHSGKLEFLALKWAVCERFADYLGFGPPFQVYTDNNPLTYVMTSAKLNATGLRWVADLANYQFTIHYKPGKRNGDADGLSRNPMTWDDMEKSCTLAFDPADLTVACQLQIVGTGCLAPLDLDAMERCCTKMLDAVDISKLMAVRLQSSPPLASAVNVDILQLGAVETLKKISREDLLAYQMEDDDVGPVYRCVMEKQKPSKEELREWSDRSKVMLHQFQKLSIEDGLLVRRTKKCRQLVLPEQYHGLIFRELHDNMGHLGPEKVEELVRQRFYWPYMAKDIDEYIHNKCACVARKKPNVPERAPLVPVMSSAPFEMVCIDFMMLDPAQGMNYVLMVTDHFSRFTQAYATKDKSAKSAAQKLFSDFIPRFGFPLRFHHDQGTEFSNSLFYELHRLTGVDKSSTTPYHPMGNGKVERMNRTLRNMLAALPDNLKKRWKDQLAPLTFAYNSTVNKATGYSPFFLVFGRNSRLPIDCVLPMDPNPTTRKTYDKFVKEWKDSMKSAFQLAYQHVEQVGVSNKRRYDKKAKAVSIDVGDRVLLRNLSERGGTGKLRPWWEQKLYVVVDVHDLVPVYTIRPIDEKKTKTVHRNMLMRVNDMPIHTFGQVPVDERRKSLPKKQKRRPRRSAPAPVVVSDIGTASDSSSDEVFIVRQSIPSRTRQSPAVVSDDSSDTDVAPDVGLEVFDATEWSTDDELPIPISGSDPVQRVSASGERSVEDVIPGDIPDLEDMVEYPLVPSGGDQPDLSVSDGALVAPVPDHHGGDVAKSDSPLPPVTNLVPTPLTSDSPPGELSLGSGPDVLVACHPSSPLRSPIRPVGTGLESPRGGDDAGGVLNSNSSSSEEETFLGFSDVSEDEMDRTLAPDTGSNCGAEEIVAGPGTENSDVTVAQSSEDASEDGVAGESVASSDYHTCDDVSPPGSPGARPPTSPGIGCSKIRHSKDISSDNSGSGLSGLSVPRRSNRRKKSLYYLTYDSDFKQQSRKRYDLYAVQHR